MRGEVGRGDTESESGVGESMKCVKIKREAEIVPLILF